MTTLTPAELRALSEQYNFDEASINDLALTIGIEKTKAICDFVRPPAGSNVEEAQAITTVNESVPESNGHNIPQFKDANVKQGKHDTHAADPQKNAGSTVKGGQAAITSKALVYNIPKVKDKDENVKQEKHDTHATDPQNNAGSTNGHAKSE